MMKKATVCGMIASILFGAMTGAAGISLFNDPTVAGWLVVIIGAACVHLTVAAMISAWWR
jgi:hypothetical protein